MDPVALLDRLARDLTAPSSPLRARALAAVAADGALSEAMARRVLDLTVARYTPDALASLRTDRFADRAVRVVLASSVAVAPLRAIALPLLYGARSLRVKPSSRQPRFASLLVEALATHDVDVALDEGAPADVVVAYGGDETLTAMRDALPEGVVFYGYGHGYGASVVTEPSEDAARAVALDVALHDQRGCLRSRCWWWETRAFALALRRR
ncbi:MAG: acyl-CoA reductase [Polyangiales bacterium]